MSMSPPASSDSGFQYVPVPNAHVPAVLAFVAARLADETLAADPHEEAMTPTQEHGVPDEWTDARLLKFSTMATRTSNTVSRMLDLLSQNPGIEGAKSTSQLAQDLNVEYSVVKAVPTQVTRVLRAHFAGITPPYAGLWGTTDFVPSRTDEMYFGVTHERAEQWRTLRAETLDGR